ncbi:hypothetical protein BKD09_42480 [Bradyrhizobium japonicum]|uniref:Uncharacterized protein n=1 Tax=Bradyrhizobium japonicum TaxID=375 RepID=A0A1L3FNW5_BRAJP|nr:hypothetical protein BKD09_42480 [Bradyrhizobium japonicum]
MLDCMSSIIHATNLSTLMLRTASTSSAFAVYSPYFQAPLYLPGSPPVPDVIASLVGWGRLETFGVRLNFLSASQRAT